MGSGTASDAELVAILLGSGRPGINVAGLAQTLLNEFGRVSGLLRLRVEDLTSVKGIGSAMASRFEDCSRGSQPIIG